MERTKNPGVDPGNTEPKAIWWRKTGGGSFRLGRRIIKPNQKFKACEHEIPKSFRDVVIPLQDLPSKAPVAPIKGVEPVYTIRPRGSGGWYDVLNAKGKALNEKALKKETAEKLVADLAK